MYRIMGWTLDTDTGLCSRQVTVNTTCDLCVLEFDHRHNLASIVTAWRKAIDLGLEVDKMRLKFVTSCSEVPAGYP
jgi:hypothetical protein